MRKILFTLLLLCSACLFHGFCADSGEFDIEPPASPVLISGNRLYTVFGPSKTLAVFDISMPKSPKLLQTIPCTDFPQALCLGNGKLYLADSVALSVFPVLKAGTLGPAGRHPFGTDRNAGPVDVVFHNGEIYTACRAGGVRVGVRQRPVDNLAVYSRAVFIPKHGHDMYAVTTDGLEANYGLAVVIPVGTPRRVRQFSDGKYYIANGFCGFAVYDGKELHYTADLNRHSSYGSFVYDILPYEVEKDGKVKTVLLAAGEIGVVIADVSAPEKGLKYLGDVEELRWGDVRGFAMGQGKILYVNDLSSGLRVLDMSNPEKVIVGPGILPGNGKEKK